MTGRKLTKVAVVTGANRGIGLEIARQLATQDIHVVGTARSDKDCAQMLAELAGCGSVSGFLLEVTSEQSVRALAGHVSEQFGRLDILVNNAGVALDQWVPGLQVDMATVRATMETNFFGVLRCCQALLPLMQVGGYGRVVNLSSELASMGTMEMGSTIAYRSSKAALNALTRLLALELKDQANIKINAACPGWVRTALGGPDAIYSPAEGADTPVWLATLPADGPSGGLFRQRQVYPW